jgi:hypothetical protein
MMNQMMKPLLMPASVLIAFAALSALSHDAQAAVRIEGQLRERGTRKPMKDVNLYLIPEISEGASSADGATAAPDASAPPAAGKPLKATTDAQGRFAVDDVPEGPFKWVVNQSGYDRLEQKDQAQSPSPPRDLYLEKSSYLGVYETTIYDKAQKRDGKTKSISGADVSKLAGASNDPIKAVQNLPGVNRSGGFSSQVIIEGSSPNETFYLIDGHEVPIIFHFGAFSTVVPPEAVDRVDLMSSGFGVEHGRTTAGLVGVWLRKPRTDRLHGLGYFDLFNVGAMLEGPIGDKSSFFIGARQSYIGLVLRAAFSGNADFNLTVAPDFRDVTGIFQTELTPIDTFKVSTVGSLDTLQFVLNAPVESDPALRGEFSTLTGFFRVIPQLTHRHSARTVSRLSFGVGRDWIRFDTSDNFFHLSTWTLTGRFEVDKELSPYWKSTWGIDTSSSWAKVDFALPKLSSQGGVPTPFSVAQTVTASVVQAYHELGAYWRNEIRVGETPWTLIPAFRVDSFSETGDIIPQPRLQVRYKLSDSLTLRTASGLYSIAPQPQEVDPSYGNPELKTPLALHVTLGAEKDFRKGASNGWELSGDLFYKHFYRRVIPSSQLLARADGTLGPENYNNNGKGRAFGVGSQAKYSYGPFSGWLTYTLSRSTRWDPSSPEHVAGFDQTHNLAAITSVEGKNNWQLSLRFRFVTGNPFTPLTGGTFDADNDIYVPTAGVYYSERVEPFWQLDMRLDKKWIFDDWILSAYLDVQNVTNHGNVEAVRYSYDYSRSETIEGLPILPILGLKGEF